MALIINVNPTHALLTLGVWKSTLDAVSKSGDELKITPKGVSYFKNGHEHAIFSINHSMLTHAIKTKNKKVATQIGKWLAACSNGDYWSPATPADPTASVTPNEIDLESSKPSLVSAPIEPTDAPIPKNASIDTVSTPAGNYPVSHATAAYISKLVEHDMTAGAAATVTVSLLSAKGLYHPVHGTSVGSVYYLIGVFDTFKIAARYKGGAMSLRAEGAPNPFQIDALVTKFGFNKTKDYWSTHALKPVDADQANMFIGALLSGVGGLRTPLPDMKIIDGKGA